MQYVLTVCGDKVLYQGEYIIAIKIFNLLTLSVLSVPLC